MKLRIALTAVALALASCASSSREGDQGEDAIRAAKLPCDIDLVFRTVCQQCHTSPLQQGAPFPLITYADTRGDFNGVPITTHMHEAIDKGVMPLAPGTITAEERLMILSWLERGAPPRAADAVCPR